MGYEIGAEKFDYTFEIKLPVDENSVKILIKNLTKF